MKPIIKYQAEDGRTFDTVAECDAYESALGVVNELLRIHTGTVRPDYNGTTYVQHPPHTRENMATLYATRGVHPRADDDNGSPWYTFWYRGQCIDPQQREWGQIYFANNPNTKATPESTS